MKLIDLRFHCSLLDGIHVVNLSLNGRSKQCVGEIHVSIDLCLFHVYGRV